MPCFINSLIQFSWVNVDCSLLTHWGRVTHICVGKLSIIGSDNGLSLGRRQAIIWTNAGILLIGPLGTNFSEISIGIQIFSFKKMHLIMSSAQWRPFCLGLNVLIKLINSLWPAGTIWQCKSHSTLAQVVACHQTSPSHFEDYCHIFQGSMSWE